MKKALSVLLIAAAVFGFYGSAVSVNDILACKDYWEEAGEKSTADMNKLEDGLNQLKDNEQAYLDGKDQVEDGEVALADAEQQLADGEVQLAAGRAELAQGYADYAAAPRKLAAGRAAISKGETDLASLYTLINGMEDSIDGFENPQDGAPLSLKDGYQKLKDGRDGILSNLDKMGALKGDLADLNLSQKSLAGILGALKVFENQAANGITHTNKDYKEFVDALKDLKPGLEEASKKTEAAITGIKGLQNGYSTVQSADADKTGWSTVKETLATMKATATDLGNANLAGAIQSMVIDSANGAYKQAYDAAIEQGASEDAAKAGASQAAVMTAKGYLKAVWNNETDGVTTKDALAGKLKDAKAKKTIVDGYISKAGEAIDGYPLLSGKKAKAGRARIAGGFATIVSKVYESENDMLISGLKGAASAVGISDPTSFAASMVKNQDSMDDFHNNMLKVAQAYKIVLPKLKNTAEDGENTLAAGRREYNQGYSDYLAAPAKLSAGERKLAEGEATLADGYKQYEEGKQALADGKDQLAQYEDGEQQVRDGLATLFNTEADLDLVSIADRLDGDGDFDNGDKHLELDEGLEAVDVGRGYQADDGVLITKEIMGRAIGTGGLLAAGVLAVIAAILSFLKKNKGAGVFAILAAAAGVFGIAYGTQAGTYFSSIAGSAVGATGWIAAGILGAVALVHAIVHFASPKNA